MKYNQQRERIVVALHDVERGRQKQVPFFLWWPENGFIKLNVPDEERVFDIRAGVSDRNIHSICEWFESTL